MFIDNLPLMRNKFLKFLLQYKKINFYIYNLNKTHICINSELYINIVNTFNKCSIFHLLNF